MKVSLPGKASGSHGRSTGQAWKIGVELLQLRSQFGQFRILQRRRIDHRPVREEVIEQAVFFVLGAQFGVRANDVTALELTLAQVASPDEPENLPLAVPE